MVPQKELEWSSPSQRRWSDDDDDKPDEIKNDDDYDFQDLGVVEAGWWETAGVTHYDCG